MLKEYTKEQNWELFEKLPGDLKEAIFSTEIADNIWSICEKNNIDSVSLVAKIVGQVLIGVLAPNELQEALTNELQVDSEAGKKITQEIGKSILYPVKNSLQKIYGEETPSSLQESQGKIKQEAIQKHSGPDNYREPIN